MLTVSSLEVRRSKLCIKSIKYAKGVIKHKPCGLIRGAIEVVRHIVFSAIL